ncbi:MAG TPA: hypothetical protein VGP07_09140 [Polyangia bacterium]
MPWIVVPSGGCGGNSLPASCTLTTTPLEGNALTLMSDARMDLVGAGFVLLGTDGANVLWETIDVIGTAGPLLTVALPTHTDGPWFGVVGTAASPGSQVVVVYAANPAGGMASLMSFAVGIDGTAPTAPAAIGMIPDRGSMTAQLLVSAGSGQAGQHAGLMWAIKGTSTVSAKVLGPNGTQVGADVTLGSVDDIDCPRFAPGQEDLTATYVKTAGTPPVQTLVAREFKADGSPDTTLNLGLADWSADEAMGCVAIAPAMPGYGLAWRANTGSFSGDYFTVFDPTTGGAYLPAQILSDERVAGGIAPPIVGVAKAGKRYILLLARTSGGEAREVDFQGHQVAQTLTFPSAQGNTGTFTSQPLGNSLFASYADYSSTVSTDHTAGSRLFAQVSCN